MFKTNVSGHKKFGLSLRLNAPWQRLRAWVLHGKII